MRNKSYYYSKKKAVKYHELVADNDVFESFYELEGVKDAEMVAIPDGRVDIQCVWKEEKLFICICGSVMNGGASKVNQFDKCFGARFRIGVLPKGIKEHINIIVDNRISMREIIKGPGLEKYLKKDLLLEQKADIMLGLFHTGTEVEKNVMIDYLVKEIEKKKGHVSVSDMIEHTGYSHRYANHIFKTNVGCSIKRFASIVRLQESFMYLVNNNDDAIYNELGYYDQAHFIKDFKNFASCTPNVIKKKADDVNFI